MPMPSKLQRSGSQHNNLYQNLTSDVLSVEEFKYTVNIGNQCLKITGDSLDLVKIAKLVPDDYFTNEEFQKSDALLMSTDTSVIPSAHPSPFIDSGVHVDLLSRSASNVLPPRQSSQEPIGDVIDIFAADEKLINVSDIPFFKSASIDSTSSSTTLTLTDDNPLATNGLNRSRRSHFSRKDSTPEAPMKTTKIESESRRKERNIKYIPACKHDYINLFFLLILDEQRIIHTSKSLWWFYSNLPLCKALPQNIEYIRDKVPGIVCEKVNIFFLNIYDNSDIIFTNKGVIYKCETTDGRKKSLKNFSQSKSFDEPSGGGGWRDNTNNSRNFCRSTSTMSIFCTKSTNIKMDEVREI